LKVRDQIGIIVGPTPSCSREPCRDWTASGFHPSTDHDIMLYQCTDEERWVKVQSLIVFVVHVVLSLIVFKVPIIRRTCLVGQVSQEIFIELIGNSVSVVIVSMIKQKLFNIC
jgi:hypothetical protein